MTTLSVVAPDGVPEVRPGDDLVGLLLPVVHLLDGDVVVITSKVVSKAEGRLRTGSRDDALAGETARVVARRGATSIVRTHHGLTMAAAGIDASNVASGTIVLLPVDPDASAAALRASIRERSGRNVGVVVTDTAGRAWREGQTDIAVGAAGLLVAESFEGRTDAHGNTLAVTAPAVADEIAGMAELAQGKLGARPFAVVRGRGDLVLPPGDDGPGARALVRSEGGDLFGYGAREAVIRALRGVADDRAPFGAAAGQPELTRALREVFGDRLPHPDGDETGLVLRPLPADAAVLAALAFAHGWTAEETDLSGEVRLRPTTT